MKLRVCSFSWRIFCWDVVRHLFLSFLRKIHLIDSVPSSVIDAISWSHFGETYDLSLEKPPHLTRYLSVSGNIGCPMIKRDRIHCVLNEGAMPFCGDPFRVLAVKIRMVGTSWISLRFPCATIFFISCLQYIIND